MNYYRKIEKPINDLKYKMQIGALLLNINNNKNNIKSLDNNLEKINTNISSNLEKINTIENDMSTLIRQNIILDKTYTIQNFSKSRNNYEIFKINLNSQFSNEGILKRNAKFHYNNNINKFSHVYKFYANNDKFKEIILNHKDNIINDEFKIKTIESLQIRISIFLVNNDGDNSLIELYDYNTIQIKYEDNINTSKINMNINDISFNLEKIEENEKDIASNLKEIKQNEKDIASNLKKVTQNEKDNTSNLINININEDNIAINKGDIGLS